MSLKPFFNTLSCSLQGLFWGDIDNLTLLYDNSQPFFYKLIRLFFSFVPVMHLKYLKHDDRNT